LSEKAKNPDAEEHDLVIKNVPIAEFEQMMLDGVIRDNCTIAAWGIYLIWKARQANRESRP
jgi:hypothetical protein